MTAMKSVDGAFGFAVPGKQYRCNADGIVDIPETHQAIARLHGFRLATDDERAGLADIGSAEEITPAVVASMKRSDLLAFLKRRDVEDIPTNTQALRMLVLEIADSETDDDAGVATKSTKAGSKASDKTLSAASTEGDDGSRSKK